MEGRLYEMERRQRQIAANMAAIQESIANLGKKIQSRSKKDRSNRSHTSPRSHSDSHHRSSEADIARRENKIQSRSRPTSHRSHHTNLSSHHSYHPSSHQSSQIPSTNISSHSSSKLASGKSAISKKELPLFYEEEAYEWIEKMERYFQTYTIAERFKVDMAAKAMGEAADGWFQWWDFQKGEDSWEALKGDLMKEFPPKQRKKTGRTEKKESSRARRTSSFSSQESLLSRQRKQESSRSLRTSCSQVSPLALDSPCARFSSGKGLQGIQLTAMNTEFKTVASSVLEPEQEEDTLQTTGALPDSPEDPWKPKMYNNDDSPGLWMPKPVLFPGLLLLSGIHSDNKEVLAKEKLLETKIDDEVIRDCDGLVTKSANASVAECVVLQVNCWYPFHASNLTLVGLNKTDGFKFDSDICMKNIQNGIGIILAGNDGLFLKNLEATISKQLTVTDRKEHQKELFVAIEGLKATEENKTSPYITSAKETSFILKLQALKHMVKSTGKYWEGRGARKKLNGMAGSYSPP